MVFILKKHIFRSLASTFQKTVFLPVLYWTLSALGLILSVWQTGDIHLNSKLNFKDSQHVFDFIIVGAGSAGSVVANRLSRHYNVLLLEAGGEPNPLQFIPGFAIFLQNWPEIDYRWRSVPQKHGSLNSVNQQSSWSAGRGLGGTGNLNTLLYLKGHPKDFDNYAEITGDPTWSYDGVTPYYNDLETYSNPKGHKRYHGFHGDLSVELPEHQGIAGHWLAAGQEFGYPEIDNNAPHTEGFFRLYHTTKNGVRHSSYKAFLQPIRLRHTITIRKFAHVNKILFDEHDPSKVIGVEYDRNGVKRKAIAKKEVIISAGAIQTPKLLMLSGVGPSKHLEKFSIPLKHDLPVGKHLQDHLGVFLGPFFLNKPSSTIYLDRDVTPGAFVNWFATGSDVLSTSGALAASVFTSSYAKARGENGWPDIMLTLYGNSVWRTFPDTFARAFNLKYDDMKRYYTHAIGKESIHIVVTGARPYARGNIELSSTSPYDSPVIDPNYLSDKGDIDLKVLVEGIKASLQLIENTTTFQEFGGKFTEVKLPGCEHLPFRSDEYWECYARQYSVTLHHACGTASMGQKKSPHTVVDSELRVIGVTNLRVIDASVIPVVPVTNTQAPTMMIGNKGADMILKYWQEIDKQFAEEHARIKYEHDQVEQQHQQQQHSELMDYIFEPINNKIPKSHGIGHSLHLEWKVPKLKLKLPSLHLPSSMSFAPHKHQLPLSPNNFQYSSSPPISLTPQEMEYSSPMSFSPNPSNFQYSSPMSFSPNPSNFQYSSPMSYSPNPYTYTLQLPSSQPLSPVEYHELSTEQPKPTPPNDPPKLKCDEEDFECWSAKFPPSFPKVQF